MERGIDPDHIGGELFQPRVAEDGVLIKTVVIPFIERRADTVGEEEDFQHGFQFADRRSRKNGDLLIQQVFLLQELAL